MQVYEKRIDTDLFGQRVSKGINSKTKGNANEREAAKAMTMWTQIPFRRTPGSGAFSHTWIDKGKVTGDIIPDKEGYECIFSIEVKHLKEIPFKQTLRKNSIIYTIWQQASSDAKRIKKLPMALLRPNGFPKFKDKNGNSIQDYIIVFERDFGGTIAMLCIKQIFEGDFENSSVQLMGFRFSALVEKLPYSTFERLIKNANCIEKYNKSVREF